MGYMKIQNLYKDQTVLLFKTVWALEKIHGTSAWITYEGNSDQQRLLFHPGGAELEPFKAIFHKDTLLAALRETFGNKVVKLHGEHYGGKIQKMSQTYGKEHGFALFDVKVGDSWLSFDKVQVIAKSLGLDVVHGVQVPATVKALDEQRDAFSAQAEKNGCGSDKHREGIVIRPLAEFCRNDGARVIVKHKGDAFRETKTKREVNPERLLVLEEAREIAEEWVTHMRLLHVLDKLIPADERPDMCHARDAIAAMVKDIELEAVGEIVMSPEARKAIGSRTAQLLKQHIKSLLVD